MSRNDSDEKFDRMVTALVILTVGAILVWAIVGLEFK